MKKTKTVISVLIGFIIVSCNFKSDSRVPKQEVLKELANEIILIFQDLPPGINANPWKTESGSVVISGRTSDIQFFDSALSFASTKISLKRLPLPYSDTVTIDTNNNLAEVDHYFNKDEYATYLFHKGDTVLFTYNGKIPCATVLNRETSFQAINYSILVRENVRNNRMSAIPLHQYHFFKETSKNEKQDENMYFFEDRYWKYLCEKEQILSRKQALDIAIEEVKHELSLQDSLHNAGLLSDYEYDYRRFSLVRLINNSLMRDPFLIQHPEYKKILAYMDLSDERFLRIEPLLQLRQYQSDLDIKVNNYLKDIKPVRSEGSGSGIAYPDFKARFDTISNLDFPSAKSKRSFLTPELKKIFEHGDRNDIEKYIAKYIAITGDTIFVNKLLAENKMDFSKSDELLLIDGDNNQTNFQKVLEKNKGKVVYVDFWASWCAPCKASMPEAKKLREEYKNKDVVFVYLALNDEESRWKADNQKLEVNYLSESYFITNSKTAHLIASLKVSTIPRYLLFNKKGELIHPNAPGPYGKEIRNQLDKTLKEI